ncbi:fungal-specific transcription factor domain-containing protein [Gloeopeniophorella convolvens]|nr:fungal-specific transcription factor domain-containing protein [Gloeopeniophorella convolvens]
MASSDPDQASMPPPPSPAVPLEYKKDGTVSRMRSHKGNVPQLPQTKLCPFCPAKFTRTTHLNRHLRNHTNERYYRCEVCDARFTRSDLLARHKKSCGESHPISRSRKRSCQACTNLKVKCDLRQPCSKCKARGRDCIYITEDGQIDGQADSPNRHYLSSSRSSGPIVNLDASAGFDPLMLGRGSVDAFSAAFPELSLLEEASNAMSQPLSEANLASFMTGAPRMSQEAISLPTIDADSDVTASSFRPGPNRAFSAFGASDVAGHTARSLQSFSSSMFQPFFRDVFAEEEETQQQNDLNAVPLLQAPDSGTLADGLNAPNFSQTFPGGVPPFDINMDNGLMMDLLTNTYPENVQSQPPQISASSPPTSQTPQQPAYPSNLIYDPTKPPLYTKQDIERLLPPVLPVNGSLAVADPSTEELQQYLYVFLTAFLPQIPVIHTPTLRFELKPPMLLRAMQACGALFIKTPVAQAFVEKTLGTSRELLVREFAKPSPDPKHQIHVIMTLILLQMIGLYHQDPRQRASSNIYHGMLVLMIRQNRLIERSATWEHQTFPTTNSNILDSTWRDWAVHECIKRVVCLAYCHDQAHRIYFSLPPSFSPTEFTMCLPCDDALWASKTSMDWSQLLLSPSPYGGVEERIHGVQMPRAFAAVGLQGPNMTATLTAAPDPPKDLTAVSPFGHFILLQALLGELFRRCSSGDSPAASPLPEGEEQVNEHVYAMQLALHRWLQMWLNNPDASQTGRPGCVVGPGGAVTGHFMADPLPFYWLAQLLLLAFQEGLPPFRSHESLSASASPPSSASLASGSPNMPMLHEPSPFAPPFAPSPFEPSPFSDTSASSSSPSVSSLSPPSAYRTLPTSMQAPGMYYGQRPGTIVAPDAAQFRLIKNWLHHIRVFLRRSQGSPTVVWDELMKIRLSGWEDARDVKGEEDGSGSSLDENGLIGFFEKKLKV